MTRIEQIKNDLKSLKRNSHIIKKLELVQKSHETRIEMLRKMEQTKSIKELIKREESLLSSLDPSSFIATSNELETKYMSIINSLDPLDKAILLDGYINGKSYREIGEGIGLGEEAVRKRTRKIVSMMAENNLKG